MIKEWSKTIKISSLSKNLRKQKKQPKKESNWIKKKNLCSRLKEKIITLEEHQVAGGLGGTISEILSENHPTKIKIMGVQNRFGQSGTVNELYKEYEIDKEAIVKKAIELIHSH